MMRNNFFPFQMGAIAWLTCCFILIWQFAQFALLTQLCSLYALHVLGFVSRRAFDAVLHGQLVRILRTEMA